MAKKMLIDATHAEETRVVVVDGNKVEEFDFETQSRRQLAGNIYLAKVTRVEPSLQAAFVDYGGNRHGFLAFNEIHPDYYQIPVADREALIAEEKAYAEAMKAEAEAEAEKPKRSRSRRKTKAATTESQDPVTTAEVDAGSDTDEGAKGSAETSADIAGMETIDIDGEEGSSPMETVGETPVDTPTNDDADDTAADVEGDANANSDDNQTNDDQKGDDQNGDGQNGSDDDDDSAPIEHSKASEKDDTIESVADEDETADLRPRRKPRPKRYKIQEVIKVRQILLIQVVKEERGNKGAALTTYLSLAGRYCVLMPNTARGGGISRKITNAADRKKLKAIANDLTVPEGAGLIIRTAGSQRTKTEIKRDYEYLQRLWEQIRELTLKSTAPSQIYEEGNLIKRSIRDLYSKEIDEVIVEGETGYRTAKDFMKMIMPSHAKNVKRYTDPMPLYARHQVESYLNGMFNPTVQLPSGGYIVIGVTEALVAIDVNSGRATKEGSIEQTALKTNLEAAEEVARQLRLRDLAGLIVIDFIDMDERKNNAAVEKRMKDKLKTDRARIQVGRISGFGLMEMSRQRLRPGMLESTTQMCPHCHGTGLLRSDDNVALGILRQLDEEGVRGRCKEVLVKAPIAIANFMMNQKREHVAQIEARYGLSVRIEGDPSMVSPDYAIEKFKTATRLVAEVDTSDVISSDMAVMANVEETVEEAETQEASAPAPEATEGEAPTKKRRRRRRRRRNGNGENGAEAQQNGEDRAANGDQSSDDTPEAAPTPDSTPDAQAEAADASTEDAPKPKRTRTRRKKADTASEGTAEDAPAAASDGDAKTETAAEPEASETPAEKPKRTRTRRKKADEPVADAAPEATETPAEAAPVTEEAPAAAKAEEVAEKPKRSRSRKKPAAASPEEASDKAEVAAETTEVPVVTTEESEAKPEDAPAEKPKRRRKTTSKPQVEADPAPQPAETAEDDKPKKRGWWSLGR
ncbi:ribonuclease E/G [Thalassorhabdomicrobium marinisediminis]|uniref:Ribonuclease E n=1 Tax=Thalassorhabdomicrobium marinisediminis TaxID=2170577 RepID=A0A2T7FVI1_9RHOB|nr:ribonuclease E/G [Thalassorhabdomicrobium marinisediminis]PVA06139.1 ribonuclease E/G [Thalassorhabdomicrobium marinisediminis]